MLDYFNQFFEAIRQFFTLDPSAPFETGAKVIGILGSACTIGTALLTKFYPWAKAKLGSRSISKRLGARLFTTASLERTVRYYIPPSCQSLDPAGGEESRLIHCVQSPLFDTLDKVLSPSSDDRYHILLADSGMGKTSALINYYARHLNRWRKRYQIEIIPLGIPDADERIKNIGNKSDTVLFLDALDEDIQAIKDHIQRLKSLLQSTHEFLHVLITCRTQFFSMDEEIPRETGVLKFGPRLVCLSSDLVRPESLPNISSIKSTSLLLLTSRLRPTSKKVSDLAAKKTATSFSNSGKNSPPDCATNATCSRR